MWRLAFAFSVAALLLGSVGTAAATHRWENLSWATTDGTVELYGDTTALGRAWDVYSDDVLDDWDASSHIVLDRDPQGKQGAVRVRSGNFGPSGWLGIAVVWINDSNHIVAGAVSLNDWYWAADFGYDEIERRFVYCQEVGHILGLGHQYVPGDSCMNDAVSGRRRRARPNAHDLEELATIYRHPSGYNSGEFVSDSDRLCGQTPCRQRSLRQVVIDVFPPHRVDDGAGTGSP